MRGHKHRASPMSVGLLVSVALLLSFAFFVRVCFSSSLLSEGLSVRS